MQEYSSYEIEKLRKKLIDYYGSATPVFVAAMADVAKVEDIKIMKANIAPNVKVKASTGIKTFETAKELIEAGAERLGTSSGAVILEGNK